MNNLGMVAWWLMVVGAINWGLSALGFNLVNMIFGFAPVLEQIVYLLVGASGVYALLQKFKIV
jgi:uncharacterized membrane protein YuzA (DUF378 family)